MGQHVQFFDDGINPKFVFHTQVSSLELESDGTLSTAGVMRHVQSAIDTDVCRVLLRPCDAVHAPHPRE